MVRSLKVFGGYDDKGNRIVGTATSKTAFCKLDYRFRSDAVCETANQVEITLCMGYHGKLFVKREHFYEEWMDACPR